MSNLVRENKMRENE